MSLKHAILGFLQGQSLTGYELKRHFDKSIQFFWPANQSQIYQTLAGMSKEGLVECESIKRDELLDKKIYHITETGREELNRWLAKPLSSSPYRDATLIQLYFGANIQDGQVVELLRNYLQESVKSFNELKGMYAVYSELLLSHPQPRSLFYHLLTIEYGLSNLQANITWITSVINRLENHDSQPVPEETFRPTSSEK